MEFLLLVVVIFSGENFSSLEIRNYSDIAEGSCDNYIGSARFRKSLKLSGIDKPRIHAACLGASEMPGLSSIVKQAAAWKPVALNQKEDIVLLTGKVRYNPDAGRTKSTDAYLGKGLVIETAEGAHVLFASEKIQEADLIKLDGKKVKLRAFFADTTPAVNAPEEYPIGPDGRPLRRVGYRIIAIE